MDRKPRKFADLRAPAPKQAPVSQEEPIDLVVRRLFNTSGDGIRVMAWLKEEAATPLPPTAPESALTRAEGGRLLIQRLILMSRGLSTPQE